MISYTAGDTSTFPTYAVIQNLQPLWKEEQNSPVNTRVQVDGANNKPTGLKKEDKILRNFKMTVHEPDSF